MAERFKPRTDIYQQTTDAICAALEKGTLPWKRPWSPELAAPSGPINAVTGKPYRGINVLLLGMAPQAFASSDPRWCSYKMAAEKGWQVKRGSKAATVIFFKTVDVDGERAADKETDDVARQTVPVLRTFPIFSAVDIEGIPEYVLPQPGQVSWRAPEAAEIILNNSGVPVREGGSSAFYSPQGDFIQLPPRAAFDGPDGVDGAAGRSATAMHELSHATLHPSRLNRTIQNRQDSRAAEELRAELASTFITAHLGIPSDVPNHASYIESWLAVLRGDRREVFRAAAEAQRICDWCLARHPDYAAAMFVGRRWPGTQGNAHTDTRRVDADRRAWANAETHRQVIETRTCCRRRRGVGTTIGGDAVMGIPTTVKTIEPPVDGLEWDMKGHLADVERDNAQSSPWPFILSKHGSVEAWMAACRERRADDLDARLARIIGMLMKAAPGRPRGKLRLPERLKLLADRPLSAYWASVSAAGDDGWREEKNRIAGQRGGIRTLLPIWRAWGNVLLESGAVEETDSMFSLHD